MEHDEDITSSEDEFNFSAITNEIAPLHRQLVHGNEYRSDQVSDDVRGLRRRKIRIIDCESESHSDCTEETEPSEWTICIEFEEIPTRIPFVPGERQIGLQVPAASTSQGSSEGIRLSGKLYDQQIIFNTIAKLTPTMKMKTRGAVKEQEEFDRAAVILSWNKKLMSTIGLWPHSRNNLRFSLNFGYFCFLMILEYLDLFIFINNLEHVIMNLTENMAFSQIFVRMSMLWKYNDEIGDLITEVFKDFVRERYKSEEERQLFISYNAKSKLFMKLLITFVALTASSYYLTPLLVSLGNGLPTIEEGNISKTLYLLPYRFYTFYPLENLQSYIVIYALELPFVFISGFGQSAADCIMVTLVYHICGQMSVLALQVNNIDINPQKNREEIQAIVESHTRLLRMGQIVAKAFSVTLLAHLLGATSLICILGYQILTNYSNGEKTVLVSFLVFQYLVLLILYAHCTVGECLLTESTKVSEAFYACQWYDMPIENTRSIMLCIARSQKPMCLTAGKFSTFCLRTLTDVLRTSMGYLSVLRSFL
ncbi:PREDICTED: odorant receptor 85c-like [Polistes dominula]|uniref:Odorant receptor 85c-like n=1 Tax=Polistes dominula TaxID=743375 RepID=A0ABM1JA89_POLDO|nr:PREDICTED: odorant receptor 85c-like [Polistes dominula]